MTNYVVLIGRILKEIEIIKENEKDIATVTIAVSRNYKNEEGIYDTDNIECILWGHIAEQTSNYCKKGDLIGIKGRIENKDNKIQIIAEKVTFLSSKKESEI